MLFWVEFFLEVDADLGGFCVEEFVHGYDVEKNGKALQPCNHSNEPNIFMLDDEKCQKNNEPSPKD